MNVNGDKCLIIADNIYECSILFITSMTSFVVGASRVAGVMKLWSSGALIILKSVYLVRK